jgi:hypothetical protein
LLTLEEADLGTPVQVVGETRLRVSDEDDSVVRGGGPVLEFDLEWDLGLRIRTWLIAIGTHEGDHRRGISLIDPAQWAAK